MVKNDYYSIACDDYKYLLRNLDSDFYNNMAVACQQICEKALKSILICINPDAKTIINSHNLRLIYNAINEEKAVINLDITKLSLLKDYYFDVRYPGDNFINVSKGEFEIAYLTLIDVLNEVNKWRVKHNLEVETPSKSLKTKQALLHECNIINVSTQDDVEDVFNAYCKKRNISPDYWEQELNRLTELFGTNDKFILANKIKELLL